MSAGLRALWRTVWRSREKQSEVVVAAIASACFPARPLANEHDLHLHPVNITQPTPTPNIHGDTAAIQPQTLCRSPRSKACWEGAAASH